MGLQDVGLKIVLLGVKEFDRNAAGVSKTINETNKALDSAGGAANRATGGLNKYADSARQSGEKINILASGITALGNKFTSLGATATALGTTLTTKLTLPIVAIGGSLVGAGILFEDAFAGVGKTVEGISDDFGNLTSRGQQFRQNLIALSLELPVSTTELSRVAQAAGQVGVPFGESGEILLEFTEIAVGLGVATDIMSEDAATAIARVANIYGIEAGNMIEFSRGFSSSLVALGNNVAATESEILNMTLRLSPAANLAGITAQETLALAASMSEMGIQAEAGGTALSTVILTMTEASKAASGSSEAQADATNKLREGFDTLHRLLKQGETDLTTYEYALLGTGVSIEGLGSKLKEYEKGLISFDDVMNHVSMKTQIDMQDALDKSSTKIGLFAEILGVSEKEFSAAFGAKPLETLQRFLVRLADLQDAGEISSETLTELGFSGIRVRTVLNTLGPNMGTLTENVNLSTEAWIKQTALQVEVQKKFATTKAQIMLVRNAFNALGIAVFDVVKPALDWLLKGIADIVKQFTFFFQSSDHIDDNLVKIAAGLALLGPALSILGAILTGVGTVLTSFVAPFAAFVTSPVILAGIVTIGGAFLLIKNNVVSLDKVFNQITTSVKNIMGLFARFFTKGSIVSPLENLLEDLKSGDIRGAVKSFEKVIGELVWFLKTIIRPAIENEFNKIWDTIVDSVQNLDFSVLLGKFDNFFNTLFGTDINTEFLDRAFGAILNYIKLSIKDIVNSLSSGDFSGAFDQFKDTLETLWKIIEYILGDKISGIINSVVDTIEGAVTTVASAFSGWVGAFIDWLIPEDIQNKLVEWKDKIVEWIDDHLPDIDIPLVDWANAFIDWIPTNKEELQTRFDELVAVIDTIITEKIPGLVSSAESLGTAIIDGITNIINDPTIVTEAILELGTLIGNTLGSISIDASGITSALESIVGEDLITKFTEALSSPVLSLVAGTFLDLAKGLRDFGKEIAKINFVGVAIGVAAIGAGLGVLALGIVKVIGAGLPILGKLIRIVANAFAALAETDIGKVTIALTTIGVALNFVVIPAIAGFVALITAALVPNLIIAGANLGIFVLTLYEVAAAAFAAALPFLPLIAVFALVGAAIVAYQTNFMGFGEAIDRGLLGFKTAIEGIVATALYLWNYLGSVDLIPIAWDIIKGLWEGITAAWAWFEDLMRGIINDIIDWFKDILGISSPSKVLMDIGGDIIQGLWDGIKLIWAQVTDYISKILTNFISWFTDILDDMLQFGKDVVNNMWNGIKFLWETFISWIKEKINQFLTSWLNIVTDIYNFGKNIVVSIQGGIQDGWNRFITWVTEKANAIKNAFGSIVTSMFNIGKDLLQGLQDGINDGWDEFKARITELFESIPYLGEVIGLIFSPSKVMADIGKNYMLGLKEGAEEVIPEVLNTFKEAFTGITMEAQLSTPSISQAMLGAATGSTISNINTASTISYSRTFAPTLNAVPMRDERSAGSELARSWRMAQVIGNI